MVKTQTNPNAEKLQDGAIQRVSVLPDRYALHPKVNRAKVGFYKSDDLTERASRGACDRSSPFDDASYHKRIVRIHYSQMPHTQNHPQNKQIGKHWVLSFDSWGQYSSPLMFWTTATCDTLSRHKFQFNTLSSAIKYCEKLGWGYDIMYPKQRWHTKKSYADNFMWKGNPSEDDPDF